MKDLTEYDRVVVYLDKISEMIRKELFENALSKPIITLQKTTGAYGHFETVPMWINSDGEKRYEINLGSETITRPIENTVATMIHEYTHYYCHINGIQDVSRNGYYHNKRFKEIAETKMLKIDYDKRIGWSITSPTDELIEWIISHDLKDIKLGRGMNFWELFKIGGENGKENGTIEKKPKKPSSTIIYICPACGTKIRGTKNLDNVIRCEPCNQIFIRKQ